MRAPTMAQADSDLAQMTRDQLIATIIELRQIIREHHYASDGRPLLPESKGEVGPPWPEFELDPEES